MLFSNLSRENCSATIDIGQRWEKELRDRPKSARIKLPRPIQVKECLSLMGIITQEMWFRQSLMKYCEKYGVKRASRKYNKSRSYIYFWKARWDGTIESLAEHSKRPHHHPNEHTPEEFKLIRDMRRRNPQLGLTERNTALIHQRISWNARLSGTSAAELRLSAFRQITDPSSQRGSFKA